MKKIPAEFKLEIWSTNGLNRPYSEQVVFDLGRLLQGRPAEGAEGERPDPSATAYSVANNRLRLLRKEFYRSVTKKNAELRQIFEENNFTVDNLIPPHILQEICKRLPRTKAELHELVIFPAEFQELEKKINDCCEDIAREFSLDQNAKTLVGEDVAKKKGPSKIEDEIFEVDNLSFLDKIDAGIEEEENSKDADKNEAEHTNKLSDSGQNTNADDRKKNSDLTHDFDEFEFPFSDDSLIENENERRENEDEEDEKMHRRRTIVKEANGKDKDSTRQSNDDAFSSFFVKN